MTEIDDSFFYAKNYHFFSGYAVLLLGIECWAHRAFLFSLFYF